MLRTGLVIANFGKQVAVEDSETGLEYRCHLRSATTDAVTGDIVEWREGEPAGTVESLSERRNALQRPDKNGRLRTVCANIDQLILVVAPRPLCHPNLVDRYLVAAEAHAVRPVVLLNKSDLLNADGDAATLAMLDRLRAVGYPVLHCSARTDAGLDALKAALKNQTSVFFGQSGVGKSSLVNALLPDVDTAVGALSEGVEKGRHTTTTTRLFHLPAGGQLIDSPGVREFSMVNLTREQIETGFPEFRPLLGHCKFRNCTHQQEPDCALRTAYAAGDIFPERWASFWQILGSLDD